MGGDMTRDDERPLWARRIRSERQARGWSQAEAVRVMRAHSDRPLVGDESLRRNWKRWEAGEYKPDEMHMRLIAESFGTVTAAMFPTENRRQTEESLIAATGMDTVEILARIRASDVSAGTLDGLRITADRLCCEYPYAASDQLQVEGRAWLGRITQLLDGRLTLAQHQEVLSLAGQVALLLVVSSTTWAGAVTRR